MKQSGSPDNPITIKGLGMQAIIDGNSVRTPENADACLFLVEVQWIVITDLYIRNCWNNGIIAKDSQYITFRNSYIEVSTHFFHKKKNHQGAEYVLYAKGNQSHHFLVEENYWLQV